MTNSLPLPWPYLPGDAAPGSFEDRVQQNMDALAIAVGSSPLVALGGTVTSLPTAPGNGQEISYLADATNGIVWRLKYRAASASTYKWEFIGGAPLDSEIDTSQTTASTTYVDLATAGPQVTLPLAGDYLLNFGFQGWNATLASGLSMSPKYGSSATADSERAYFEAPTSTGLTFSASRQRLAAGFAAAGSIVKCQYRTTAGTATFLNRYMTALPIRVG